MAGTVGADGAGKADGAGALALVVGGRRSANVCIPCAPTPPGSDEAGEAAGAGPVRGPGSAELTAAEDGAGAAGLGACAEETGAPKGRRENPGERPAGIMAVATATAAAADSLSWRG